MNPEQAIVVDHVEGPLAVRAVAGAGKTHAVVGRICRLIERGTPPSRILAVTFSKKGADEMNERLRRRGVFEARVGTWHSLALQILRGPGSPWAGWSCGEREDARFKILVKDAVGFRHLDWKGADVTKVLRTIGHCKARMISCEDAAAVERVAIEVSDMSPPQARLCAKAYAVAQGLAEAEGILPFDDMLMRAVELLRDDEEARASWAARWDHVIQDESQDANLCQKLFGELLAKDHRNYMMVGDARQAIYSFRGSDWRYLMGFEQEWGARVVDMCRNYRCGAKILEAANTVIREGDVQPCPDAIAESGRVGSVEERTAATVDEEAQQCAQWVRERAAEGADLSTMCVLFRVNAQSRALEEAFLRQRIPYVLLGGVNFYERKVVKDLVAYLRVAFTTCSGDDIGRCINAPFRFLGRAFVDRLREEADAARGVIAVDWCTVVRQVAERAGIQRRQRASAEEFVSIVQGLKAMVAQQREEGGEKADVGLLLDWVVSRTGYLAWLQKEEGDESVENSSQSEVRELLRVAKEFRSPEEFLAYVDQVVRESKREDKSKGSKVTMMSIHRSKGLEYERVWVVGMVEGVLPHARGDVEEERRLAYVAMTRAKEELVLSWPKAFAGAQGSREMQPSRFLVQARCAMPEPPASVPDPDPSNGLEIDLVGGEP